MRETLWKYVTSLRHIDDVVWYWFQAQATAGIYFEFGTGSSLWNKDLTNVTDSLFQTDIDLFQDSTDNENVQSVVISQKRFNDNLNVNLKQQGHNQNFKVWTKGIPSNLSHQRLHIFSYVYILLHIRNKYVLSLPRK